MATPGEREALLLAGHQLALPVVLAKGMTMAGTEPHSTEHAAMRGIRQVSM